jgi:hypothetical protein
MHIVTFAFFLKELELYDDGVVVASNLMPGVLINCLMFVACSIVGNPMICGSNAGAGECAAALPPVTVPFPLESTPGGSSEHSSCSPCF